MVMLVKMLVLTFFLAISYFSQFSKELARTCPCSVASLTDAMKCLVCLSMAGVEIIETTALPEFTPFKGSCLSI